MTANGMRIGELARASGCQVETIRFYERRGLLGKPRRSGSNYRLYEQAELDRLQFIRLCRAFDMSLEEIERLLCFRDRPQQDCSAVNALLDEHLEHVRTRIAELRELKQELERLRASCTNPQSSDPCVIVQSLQRKASSAGSAVRARKKRARRTELHDETGR